MRNFHAFEFGLFCLLIGFTSKFFLGDMISYGIIALGIFAVIFSFKR